MTEADIEALYAHLAILRQHSRTYAIRKIRVDQALRCATSASYVVRAAAAKTLAEEVMELRKRLAKKEMRRHGSIRKRGGGSAAH